MELEVALVIMVMVSWVLLKSQWYHGDSQNTCKAVLTSRILGFYPTGAEGMQR